MRPQKTSAYVVDLGIACEVGNCGYSGTVGFVAPEIWERGEITVAVDVFSLVVVRL